MRYVSPVSLVLLILILVWAGVGIEHASGGELPFHEGSTTVVVLPDTQRYAQRYHDNFAAQTQWIAEQHEGRNIAYVVHLGDITQDDLPREWDVSRRCFDMIEGKVPYLVVPGNHDYHKTGDEPLSRESRTRVRRTRINEYFHVEDMRDWPTFGGVFEKGRVDNQYHLTEINGQRWILLGLEYGPRDEVLEWANDVLREHCDRRAMIVTHAYLFRNHVRYDKYKGRMRASPHLWGNDGEEQWDKLVRRHPNVMIVISGHVRTGGPEGSYLASEGDYGNTVHQMMTNYQKLRGGGKAYLRLLEFLPDGQTVQVRTYSPRLDHIRNSTYEEFTFELQGPTRNEPRPVVSVPPEPLRVAPIHRYNFEGAEKKPEGKERLAVDTIRGAHAVLHGNARLDGKGRMVLGHEDHAALPASLLEGQEDVSLEVWFTPTAERYDWDNVIVFSNGNVGRGGHYLNYRLRTLTVHRAAISVGDNEDIQRLVPAEPGKTMHVVLTYDADGADGKALLCYYRDGENYGRMPTTLKLTDVEITEATLGPFAGEYDEVRIYDYPLSEEEVAGNYDNGPDRLVVEDDGDG